MKPVFDIEVSLLQAVALSSKRKPADLLMVMAALDLTHGALAAEFKLTEAFNRLSSHGLIAATDDGITLTAAGEEIMAAQPRKAPDDDVRIARVKETLADYHASGEDEPIGLTVEQVRAAIHKHRIAAKSTQGKNMLMPKKPAVDPDKDKRKGKWRKSAPPRRTV